MVGILIAYPVLLLFIAAALGFLVGRIRVGGFSLGVSGVLFSGIVLGAIDPRLRLPDFSTNFGLVVFVYTVGLSSGSSFFASLRTHGIKQNALVLGVLAAGSALTATAMRVFHLTGPSGAGLFSGATTNAPALAALVEQLHELASGTTVSEDVLTAPVVAFSVTYPLGAVGMIVVLYAFKKAAKIDFASERPRLVDYGIANDQLVSETVRLTTDESRNACLRDLMYRHHWRVIFVRWMHQGTVRIVSPDDIVDVGDLLGVVGPEGEVERVISVLGERSDKPIDITRDDYDFRRIFVSKKDLVGKRLRDVNLYGRFGARVTRIRRGDVDFLPSDDVALELGDRVRVVAPTSQMPEVSKFFGDSYRSLSEIDIAVFGLGIALGLGLGLLPFPLPNGSTFKLGFAGGPLLAGLLLGALGRTGPITWSLPYGANLTLRQLGIILFLAGIGTYSGRAFLDALHTGLGWQLMGIGAVITCLTAMATLVIGYYWMRTPLSILSGVLAGLQTQPALLSFAKEQTDNDAPDLGYAMVYPVATVAKILLAQALLVVIQR